MTTSSTPIPVLPSLASISSELLASQYKKPNIIKIIASICGTSDTDPALTMQNTLYAIANQPYSRMLNYAQGVQLDGIGDIIGQKRPGGTDDSEYRGLLFSTASSIRSSGTFEQVYNAASNLSTILGTGNTPKILLKERFPLSVEVVIFDLFENISSKIAIYLKGACAASVYLSVICTNAAYKVFLFGGSTQTFVLQVNGAELIVNNTYSISATIASSSLTNDEGFGLSKLANSMQ